MPMATVLKHLGPKRRVLPIATLVLAFMACSAPVLAEAQPQGAEVIVLYRITQGDNLYTLAERYLAKPEDYRVVQRLNRVAYPRRVPVGLALRIPRRLLKQEPVRAVVQSYRGMVKIGARPASVGMLVSEGDLIETGQKSFITLMLPDDTVVSLPSHSAIRVRRLRRTVLGHHLERLFAIEYGRANATVTPMTDPLSDFRFSTPAALTSVRGTKFRMSYDPAAARAAGEVLEGKVAFTAPLSDEQLLATGFGTTNGLAAPVPLLAPPDLLDADRAQSDEDLHFVIKPAAGAVRYHVQIGRDAGFLEVLDEVTTAIPEARLASLPNGSYFVRLTAIDVNELEGQPATYAFERRLNRISTSLEQSRAGRYRQYLFRWRAPDALGARYRFQLWAAEGEVPMVDEIGLTGMSFIVTDLPKGQYRWRVMTSESVGAKLFHKWTDYRELRVENAR